MSYEADTESGEFVWIDLKVHTQLFTIIIKASLYKLACVETTISKQKI